MALGKIKIPGSNCESFLMYVYTQFSSSLLFNTLPNY